MTGTPPPVSAGSLTYDEALSRLISAMRPVEGEDSVPLRQAAGRILARDLVALGDLPPWDNAALDGYAVRTADLAPDREVSLRLAFRIAAGQAPAAPLGPGQAARIFTGAMMPAGADAMIAQERCREEAGGVWIPPGLAPGDNVRKAGEDFAAGDILIGAGRQLRAQEVALAAAAGHPRLAVRRAVRVAVLATGSELVEPGSVLRPGQINDSNRFALGALLDGQGAEWLDLGLVADERTAVAAAFERAMALKADLILSSGGVSVGEEDHVKAVLDEMGRLDFWRIAIKPGRPLAFGSLGAVPFIGLPGNPVSAMVTFLMFVRPCLRILAGAGADKPLPIRAVAGFAYKKPAGRREWLRGVLAPDGSGRPTVCIPAGQGSAMMRSLTEATGLVELPETLTAVSPGDEVDFLSFRDLMG